MSLQEKVFDDYPDLTPKKRDEYGQRLAYVGKLLEGKPFGGRK